MAPYSIKLSEAAHYFNRDEYDKAEALFKQILSNNPKDDAILYRYGLCCYKNGKVDAAIDLLLRAISIKPQIPYLTCLAEIYLDRGLKPEAIDCYQTCYQINPNDPEFLYILGLFFFNEGEYEEAINSLKTAFEFTPNDHRISYLLALVFNNISEPDEAIYYYEKTIQLDPHNSTAYYNLGLIYYYKNQFDMAEKYLKKALAINPESLEIYKTLGNMFADCGNATNAIKITLEGLKYYPNQQSLCFILARAQFLAGNICDGWEYFKHRRILNEDKSLKSYLLDYSDLSLKDKAVYVYHDTGFGDTIQFIRYLSLLKEEGAKVTGSVQPELVKLLQESKLNVEIIPPISNNNINYDYQINLTSLAYRYKTGIENIPYKEGYLDANPEQVRLYREKYFDNSLFKIGLVWKALSNPEKNLNDISSLLELARIIGIKFYSLQKDVDETNINGTEVISLGDTFTDFSNTAAAISNLDLLITVDTASAHLSGALGKPTWIIIPKSSNWRWFLDRTDCPWYTSVRLFRQNEPGNWNVVINEICKELKSLVN